MRASATSNFPSPPANPQAVRSDAANQHDQASPFALLMASTAPKDKGPARQDKVEKPSNDNAPAAAPDKAQPAKSQTESKASARTKPDGKAPARKDDQDSKEETASARDAATDGAITTDAQPAPTDPVPPAQPNLPLVVAADMPVNPPPSQGAALEDVTPAIAAVTPQTSTAPVQDITAPAGSQTEAPKAPQNAPQAPAPAASQTIAQASGPQNSNPQDPILQAPVRETPDDSAPQNADLQPVVPQAPIQQTQALPVDAQQIAALQTIVKPAVTDEQREAPEPQSAPHSATIGTDAVKPVAHGAPDEQAAVKDANDARPEPGTPELRTDVAKADSAKPEMVQPAGIEAHKSTPLPPQAAPNTNLASHTGIAGQAQQIPATLVPPAMPAQVQVSNEAARPNLPALAVEIAAKSQSGAKQFDIRLDPPELGRVEVRLSIDAAGKASAHLSADQPQTLDLLQKDASSLTRALREAGLNVSQDGLNFSLRQQSHDGGSAQQGQTRGSARALTLIATQSIEATQTSAAIYGDGRVDIRV